MKKENFNDRFSIALITLSLLVFSACGSTGSADGRNSPESANNGGSVKTETAKTEAANTESADDAETAPRDTTPVTISSFQLFNGNYRYTSDVEEFNKKYKDRMMTVSDMYLWEISSSELTAANKKEPGGNFIKCAGSFSEYLDSASKIKEIRERGTPMKATVKGSFKSARQFGSDQLEMTLDPCVLAEIEK